MDLFKQIGKLTLLGLLIHEFHHFTEGSAPKFYNTALSFTPIRITEGSIIKSAMQILRTAREKPMDLFVGKAAV